MRYTVIAFDYDGTLTEGVAIAATVIDALRKLRASNRKLILITGRLLGDLLNICPVIDLFSLVVAENGGLIYCPDTGESRLLTHSLPDKLLDNLKGRGVDVMHGQCIASGQRTDETAFVEALAELGLDYQIIPNKSSLMVLPVRIDKGSGLKAALTELKVAPENTLCVGDAENDLPMFRLAGSAVALNNALDSVKAEADYVTNGNDGQGIIELVERLLTQDIHP